MRRFVLRVGVYLMAVLCMARAVELMPAAARPEGDSSAELDGFFADSARVEHDWEVKFRALPSPANMRSDMQRISARPHHVGTEYDHANAEWILSQFRDWGWDAQQHARYRVGYRSQQLFRPLLADRHARRSRYDRRTDDASPGL